MGSVLGRTQHLPDGIGRMHKQSLALGTGGEIIIHVLWNNSW